MLREGNYIQQLSEYIKRNLIKGYTIDSLKIALEQQDYSKSAIERAIDLANKRLAKDAPIMKEKPVIKYKIIDENSKNIKQKSILEKIKKLFR